MSIHNLCFSWKNKKNIDLFGLKKASYQELCMDGHRDNVKSVYDPNTVCRSEGIKMLDIL